MISKLEVGKVEHKVEAGSVILSESEGGRKYTYLVVDDNDDKFRLIDVERSYLFSFLLKKDEVIKHVESFWDEKILRVFKKDEIQIAEAK